MKNVLTFLEELNKNNHKEWMDDHRKWYLTTKQEFHDFVNELIQEIAKFDDGVLGLTAKDCTFRINRDIRFSKDKSPYKTNFGAAIQEGGKKSPNPTYYLHLQPGESFAAGGLYMPDAENLAKVRQEIDYNAGELKNIVESSDFAEKFGAIQGDGNDLKTAPKGYPKDHPNIDLLRKKSFIVTKPYTDQQVESSNFLKNIAGDFATLKPLNQYLGVAIS